MCVEVLEGSLFTCHVKVCRGGDKVSTALVREGGVVEDGGRRGMR